MSKLKPGNLASTGGTYHFIKYYHILHITGGCQWKIYLNTYQVLEQIQNGRR
ncbi:hypothetical protein LL038_15020 [Clostridium estertheticum]|uniref:Uncharacterized protein n=1 Tax=Clostridium estertheticum TaxID=238834 RepID=A0AA47EEX5_9CLOT|nr:hypothetical protein LL038_15020 [Clostridium estertheticum]